MAQSPDNPYGGGDSTFNSPNYPGEQSTYQGGQPGYMGGQPVYPEYPGYNASPATAVRKPSAAFRENAAPWCLAALIYIALTYVVEKAAGNYMVTVLPGNEIFPTLRYSWLAAFLGMVVSLMVGVNFSRNAIAAVDGHKLELKDFFSFQYLGYYLLAQIVVVLCTFLGILLLIIPGLIFAFFAYWAVLTAVDYRQPLHGPINAIKRSIQLVKTNPGRTFLVLGIAILLGFFLGLILGFLPAGDSILSIAFTTIFSLFFAYYYRLSQLSSAGISGPFPY